jgi:hypothetical protein
MSPVVKYDVEDVESGGGGEEPQPATYPGKIVSMTHRKKRNDGTAISDFEVVVDIGKEFVRLWTYIKLPDDPNWSKESHGCKLRELTDALGLPPKGGIDPAKVTKEQPPVLVKVTSDTHRDTGEYRGRIKNLFPIGDNKMPEAADDDAPADSEGPYGREEIESWSDDDAKGYADELGVEVPKGRGWRAKLNDALVDAEEGTEDGAGDHDASADGDPFAGLPDDVKAEAEAIAEQGSDYIASWEDDDIKWLVEGLGLDGSTSGRGWKPKAITAIVDF